MPLIRVTEHKSWRKRRTHRPNAGVAAATTNPYSERDSFGLLPVSERGPASFVTSTAINGAILALLLLLSSYAKQSIQEHLVEQTELIIPNTPPAEKIKPPAPVKLPDLPKPPDIKFEAPKIHVPQEPKPDLKPIQEAKLALPVLKAAKPNVILAPQPKMALSAAAMPAQDNRQKPSTKPVHFGQTFGVAPNPNATRPATVAAIGNPYGGMRGPAVAPHGVVGSTGIGNGLRSGSNSGVVGRVASAGIPGSSGTAAHGPMGTVSSVHIPSAAVAASPMRQYTAAPASTNIEVLSKPAVQYTAEARQLHIQGDVVLRVTFTASGRVVVQGVIRSLGHGLDEEARRVAQQIRFRPATRNGQPVDSTTTITITFQLA